MARKHKQRSATASAVSEQQPLSVDTNGLPVGDSDSDSDVDTDGLVAIVNTDSSDVVINADGTRDADRVFQAVYCSQALKEALATYAQAHNMSASEVCRQAIASAIGYDLDSEPERKRQTKYESPEARKRAYAERAKAERAMQRKLVAAAEAATKLRGVAAMQAWLKQRGLAVE